ncbi:MAG TPA: CHAT domain-containing tetratricopeptide repeat protein, partial [Pyrinomonadaceae bacterium]|nr:CHAT domain-containing tetratricopeptide repeat protein [Pyrinomonadaceae bacterium]
MSSCFRPQMAPRLLLCSLLLFQVGHRANAQTPDPSRTQVFPPQQPAAQTLPPIVTLESGKPIAREISGAQKHTYKIVFMADQYQKVTVDQRGIDVVVRLLAPDGKLVVEIDGESRPVGQEVVELVSATAGVYQIEIEPRSRTLPAEHYEICIAESRVATDRDRSLDEARRLHWQARQAYLAAKYREAIRAEEDSLRLRERLWGPDQLEVAQSLFALGLYCRNAGDIPRAEGSYLHALAIREKVLGPDHPDVALVLHNLGYLYYYDVRDYARAAPLYERALAIKEKAFGPDHPLVAMTLTNIGLLEWKKKNYAGAAAAFLRSLAIIEKRIGPESELAGTCLHNLGIVYKESGDYARGESYYRRALEIWERALGKEHPRVAFALESLGILYRDKGDYQNAEPFLRRALAIEEKSEGANHPDVANTLVILARLYEAKGDTARAIELQSRASAIEETNIELNLSLGSERQKLAYFSSMMKEGDRRVSLHVRSAPSDPKARDLALTMILQRKGRVLDALADVAAAWRQKSSAQDQTLLNRLNSATAQLAQLVLDGPDGETAVEHQKKIDALQQQREDLEDEVSRRTAGLYQTSQPVTLDAIRGAIPPDAALIEFAIYHPSDPGVPVERDFPAQPHYVAYIIRKSGDPQWQELGNAKDIDAKVDALRQALRDPQRGDVQRLARALDEKVMQPIRAALTDARLLLISADGELNLTPFAALVDEQGRYLVQGYSITYLTSGRDLLRMQVGRQSRGQPVVLADPAFGDPALLAERQASHRNAGVKSNSAKRIDASQVFFGPLPGVNAEVRALRELLPNASFLTREQATKAALQSVDAPSILHIATHGFFLAEPGEALVATGSRPGITRGISTNARIENPLLRSGLALAGANRNGESGILTALEAAGLNLWGTKLVVLSACDTGIGQVRNGEGVYGLRRALILAGTESQVMSLWPVSDSSTR